MRFYFLSDSNNVQQGQQLVYLQSCKCYSHKGGLYVQDCNFRESVGLFNARILPKHTWINDQDRFLKPNKEDK